MGPNNSGKSYAATLIYSLLSAYALSKHRSSRQAPFTGTPANQSYDGLHSCAKKLAAAKDSFTVPNTAAARSRLVNAVFAPVLKTVDEVAPYLFRKAGKGGYIITPIGMNEYGVDLQEFMGITESLYERGFKQDQ